MNIRRRIRHIRRYRQISRVFLKHGLGYLVHRLGMERYVPLPALYSLQKCEREPDYCLADKLTHAFMVSPKSLYGFFQSDPHPGNIMVLP